MRDDAITMLPEEQHLPFPVVRAQCPAVAENDRLPLTPVLVINLCSVFRRNRRHNDSPLSGRGTDVDYPAIAWNCLGIPIPDIPARILALELISPRRFVGKAALSSAARMLSSRTNRNRLIGGRPDRSAI